MARVQIVSGRVLRTSVGHGRQQAAAEALHEAAGDDLRHRRGERADQGAEAEDQRARRRKRGARRSRN
jgi:hypothetical protein